ncbi:hypothetical protein [Ancylobacter terrae]|uniref:hypothetical protein n=1 Tax=Ancylobacter sp. sgz301288 TaxID=3342077 RepID=UPI00385DC696
MIAAARPPMIAPFDGFRAAIDDFGGGLGVMEAVSGPIAPGVKAGLARSVRLQGLVVEKEIGFAAPAGTVRAGSPFREEAHRILTR